MGHLPHVFFSSLCYISSQDRINTAGGEGSRTRLGGEQPTGQNDLLESEKERLGDRLVSR